MVSQSILTIVKTYLLALKKKGIPIYFGVIYGSQATGHAQAWSDIDLLVVSPAFDREFSFDEVSMLWRTAARIDSRIEPIPIGAIRYETEDGSPLLTIARREGEIVSIAE